MLGLFFVFFPYFQRQKSYNWNDVYNICYWINSIVPFLFSNIGKFWNQKLLHMGIMQKALDWNKKFAAPTSSSISFGTCCSVPSFDHLSQACWFSTFNALTLHYTHIKMIDIGHTNNIWEKFQDKYCRKQMLMVIKIPKYQPLFVRPKALLPLFTNTQVCRNFI